jgi:hypothetical protein
MPGVDAREAARIIAGELPDLVHVPELPARGPGADMVGRTGSLLCAVDPGFGLETTPGGWRICGHRGRLMRRGESFVGEDLDALQEESSGYRGPVKAQIVGPWTMAASIELRSGERMLRDAGSVDELAHALAEAAVQHVLELRRRMPAAPVILLQLDEPALPAVIDGRIGTASGLSRYPAVDPQRVGRLLGVVLTAARAAGAVPGVHCCADDPPVDLLREAHASFVSIDITAAGAALDQQLGVLLEAGGGLIAGAIPSVGVPSVGGSPMSDARVSAPLRDLLHRLGLEEDRHLSGIAVSPTCGLAGASPTWACQALAACSSIGRVMRQDETREGIDVD